MMVRFSLSVITHRKSTFVDSKREKMVEYLLEQLQEYILLKTYFWDLVQFH